MKTSDTSETTANVDFQVCPDRNAADPSSSVAIDRPPCGEGAMFSSRAQSISKPMKVMLLGLRGFPGVQGGVEKHCEELAQELTALHCDVTAVVRSRYMAHFAGSDWNGVHLLRLWSPKTPILETIVHSLLGVIVAAYRRPDVIHVHGIGPSLVVPFARLAGLRTVVTHHGHDYERQKWGLVARFVLRLGEYFGMKFSHKQIGVSSAITLRVRKEFRNKCQFIPNGVRLPEPSQNTTSLDKLGLVKGRYILTVARIVPEKRQLDIIKAFKCANLEGWKLALVGGEDHRSRYLTEVTAAAHGASDVVLAGFQCGPALAELYTNAGLFVLPSSHEGLPIALLEALSYGLSVVVSDIPAHREIELDEDGYFPVGNVGALTARLSMFISNSRAKSIRRSGVTLVAKHHNWRILADKIVKCYVSD